MKLWQELRRRRVFRMTGLYIVGAWVVIQVAEVSFEAWGIPDSALRYLFIAAFACFPVALVFSWRYDITSEGIVRTERITEDESVELSLKWKDYVILSALLGIGVVVLTGSFTMIQDEVSVGQGMDDSIERYENSIAVLPFNNLDLNPETGYFSDGITEDILNRLAGLKTLHVLASNTSFAFRDSQEGPAEILRKLGVKYLLQGSIRRELDNVRITARLIDEGGFQVWSDQFDRQLVGVFAIQAEIASQVASQVINEIVPLAQLPEGRTTENMEAYDQYLVGKAFLDKRTPNWRDLAIAAFEKAIDLDPGFAPPYAGLAKATTVMRGPDDPLWEEGKRLAEQSIELDPELAAGHAALGLVHMAQRNLDAASMSLRMAIDLNPSLGFAHNILAFTLARMGRDEEADAVRRRGLAVDPLNPPLVNNVAWSEAHLGNYKRAEQLLLRLLSLPEPPQLVYSSLWELYDFRGRFVEALDIMKQATRVFATHGEYCCNDWMAWTYGNLGMTEQADYWMGLALEDGQVSVPTLDLTENLLILRGPQTDLGRQLFELVNRPGIEDGLHNWPVAQLGLVNIYMGNYETGARQLDLGLRQWQARMMGAEISDDIDVPALQGSPADVTMVMQNLAFAYRQLGRIEEADAILANLSEAFDLQKNGLQHAMLGDPDAALEALLNQQESGMAKYQGPNKYYEIIHDPRWAETLQQPGFAELLADMKEEVDRQRAKVEVIEAEHDFKAEIERLMAN